MLSLNVDMQRHNQSWLSYEVRQALSDQRQFISNKSVYKFFKIVYTNKPLTGLDTKRVPSIYNQIISSIWLSE